MKKFFIILILLVVVIGVLMHFGKKRRAAEREETLQNLTYYNAELGDIQVRVTASGTIEPATTVEVKSKAGGDIIKMPFGLGDKVRAGDLLMELDPSDEERAVERAAAQLATDEARLATAKSALELSKSNYTRALAASRGELDRARATLNEVAARYERQRELLKRGTISAQELERVEAEWRQAEARLAIAEADLADAQSQRFVVEQRQEDITLAEAGVKTARIARAEAQERLDETRIVSPLDGTITKTFVLPGQVVASALSNVGGGTSLLEVANLSRLFVEASIDEVDIGLVAEDQKATITADAFPGEEYEGVVRIIAPKGESVENVVAFTVQLEIVGEGLERLRPGMTVDVAIHAGERTDVLLLPVQAVYYDEERPYVIPADVKLEKDDDEESWRYIETGITDGLQIEILNGLEAGEEVRLKSAQANRTWRR